MGAAAGTDPHLRSEAPIARRNRRIDSALRTRKRATRLATLAVLLLGAAVLLFALNSPERKRLRVTNRVALGAGLEQVAALLGPPGARCPAGSLARLRTLLPAGLSPVAAEATLAQLRAQTAERWLYPLDRRRPASCTGPARSTEIGLDREGRVLWSLAIPGRGPLRLPNDFLPGGDVPPADSAGTE